MEWDHDQERKAGRAMSIGGSIYAIIFIVIWCAIAIGMGAWFMLIFGLPMLGFAIFRLAVMLQKSKKKPQDPWEQAEQSREPRTAAQGTANSKFCPYCGNELGEVFAFCPKCGRRLS